MDRYIGLTLSEKARRVFEDVMKEWREPCSDAWSREENARKVIEEALRYHGATSNQQLPAARSAA